MELTLRQARRLEQAIHELLNDGLMNSESFTLFGKAPSLTSFESDFLERLAKKRELIRLRFKIRQEIDATNHTSGLSQKMAQEAALKAEIALLTEMIPTQKMFSTQEELETEFAIKLTRLNQGTSDGYNRPAETVRVSLIGTIAAEELELKVRQLKRLQQVLADQMLQINMTATIKLSQETGAAIQKFNLL